jgi:allantoate deiminase
VRFPVTLTGSRALAGTLGADVAHAQDAAGVRLGDALAAFGGDPAGLAGCARDPAELLGYVEAHIEQGPVLEAAELPVGVVTAIAGAIRLEVVVEGEAGHAGTVPMGRRRDALAGAAEMILAVERLIARTPEAVGTVGRIEVQPGAPNVIPGEARLTVDLRAPGAAGPEPLRAMIETALEGIAAARGLAITITMRHRAAGCKMDGDLSDRLAAAIAAAGLPVTWLPSGAGHDAMAMAAVTPVAMLFVRCRRGLSHHPDEHVAEADLGVAAEILARFLLALPKRP